MAEVLEAVILEQEAMKPEVELCLGDLVAAQPILIQVFQEEVFLVKEVQVAIAQAVLPMLWVAVVALAVQVVEAEALTPVQVDLDWPTQSPESV